MDAAEMLMRIDEATVRSMVLAEAMQALFQHLPSESRPKVAAALRSNVAEMMEEANWPSSSRLDEIATLQLASLLEALGEPPTTNRS